jgi:16S rRNA (guanine966-N2)-methyltransferase
VIAGLYRGRRLQTVPGLDTRPTSDRLRETLFNVLSPCIQGSNFLDICAGSGAVGIEALSRGAARVTFVERARTNCSIISENLRLIDAEESATVINQDAVSAVRLLINRGDRFDLVFFDPPYASDLYSDVIQLFAPDNLLREDGMLIVEHARKTPPERRYGNLGIYRELKQGESAIAFYKKESGQSPQD